MLKDYFNSSSSNVWGYETDLSQAYFQLVKNEIFDEILLFVFRQKWKKTNRNAAENAVFSVAFRSPPLV